MPQKQFWNEWAQVYQGFSETIRPYQEAQQLLARSAVAALQDNIVQGDFHFFDIGGGSGNMVVPMLEALLARRGNLKGVSYTLTDASGSMLALTQKKFNQLKLSYPEVTFQTIEIDTLDPGFQNKTGMNAADIVISSWNIEYYTPENRLEVMGRLRRLVHNQGVVAFSSIVRLPDPLSIRQVLMPLGGAQVVYSFLTGGPQKMKKVVTGLKQIALFGEASGNCDFPQKPTLDEMKELAREAGLQSITGQYHLYGASAMVLSSKTDVELFDPPEPVISRVLAGQKGYDGCLNTVSFWSYLRTLLRQPKQSPTKNTGIGG